MADARRRSPAAAAAAADGGSEALLVEELAAVDFQKNPYSCDWRADRSKTACNQIRYWLKVLVLIAQAAAYIVYLATECDSLRCTLCLVYGCLFYTRIL